MIALNNIRKIYKGKNVDTVALQEIDLSIVEGEYVCLFGKSGCGKTTLLNILGGMDTPTAGAYLYRGRDVNCYSMKELARFRNREVGTIFQSFHLLPGFTAMENVAMPLGYGGMGKSERERKAHEMLKRVGLLHKAKSFPAELSGGEQQRVAVARALVHGPSLLLCDEPTGNLDEKNALEVMDLIEEMRTQNTTLVLVTHDPDLSARAERLLVMHDGRIVEDLKGKK